MKKTIDITPTWISLYPLFHKMIMEGTKKQKEYVSGELKRLCIAADSQKEKRKK